MGHTSSSGNSNSKLIFAQISMKKGEDITINLKEAPEGKGTPKDIGKTNQVYGRVTKLETVKKTFEGVEKASIRLWLKDNKENELIILTCGMNSIGRNIINSLASVEGEVGEVNLQVYMNKKGYPAVAVAHNGKKTEWKYNIEEQNKHITQTKKTVRGTGGSKVEIIERDYFDLDEIMLADWAALSGRVVSKPQDNTPANVEEPVLAGDEEGLPF